MLMLGGLMCESVIKNGFASREFFRADELGLCFYLR